MAEEEQQLDGGNVGGAVRAGNTVRRAAGPWTPAVHEVVRTRVQAHADGVRSNAAPGNEVFERLLAQGVADDLDRGLAELCAFPG